MHHIIDNADGKNSVKELCKKKNLLENSPK